MAGVDVEEVSKILGSFGRYQRFVFFLICFVMIPCAFVNQATVFLGVSTDHHCRVSENQTYEENSVFKLCTIPSKFDNDSEEITWEKCTRYDVNVSDVDVPEDCHGPIIKCYDGWVYDRSTYDNTIVHEFNLVCDRAWLNDLALLMVPLGKCVGAIVLGQLSDILGRKHVFFTSLLLTFVVGFVTTFSIGPIFYMVGQFFLGFLHSGIYLIAMVIGIELVSMQHRAMAIAFFTCFHAVGYITLSVLALLFHSNWQHLLFTTSLSWLIYFPYYWLLPESLRWLINKNRFIKAHRLVDKTARHNNIELPVDFYKKFFPSFTDEKEKYQLCYSMFRSPKLTLRIFIVCLVWFSLSSTHHAIFLKAAILPITPYIRPVVSGIIQIPACIIAWWLVSVFGRRWLLAADMVLAGVAVLAAALAGHTVITATFAVISKFFLSMAYVVVILVALEISPTPLRNVGLGLPFAFSAIGTIASPYILKLDSIWTPLPFVIFGAMVIITGVLALLLLPETRKQKLPQSLDDLNPRPFKDIKSPRPKRGGGDSSIALMEKAAGANV